MMERQIYEFADSDTDFQASFVSSAKIVQAKIYRPENLWLSWIRRQWRFEYLLVSTFVLFPIAYVHIRQRFLLAEVIWLCIFTVLVGQGVRVVSKRHSGSWHRLTGLVLLVPGLIGLITMNLPSIQSGFRRCHLVKSLEKQGLKPVLYDPFFGENTGWISVFDSLAVPTFITDLFGGPAMFLTFAHVDLPQDMLSEELVDTLQARFARRNTRVNLLPSKSQRPPNLKAFQSLVSSVQLDQLDATWFDASTFASLNSSPQQYRILRFNGHLSDDAISGLRMSNLTYFQIELSNLLAGEIAKLGLIPARSNMNPKAFHFVVKNCEWTPQNAELMAERQHFFHFVDVEPEQLALCAEHGVNLQTISWYGSMTQEQAASIASNARIQDLYGKFQFEPGAIEAISKSRSVRMIANVSSPVGNEDLAFFSQMASLERLIIERCEADVEAIRQLADMPNMKYIDIRYGKLTAQQLGDLMKESRSGRAEVRQANQMQ